jgi:hypothetical protein
MGKRKKKQRGGDQQDSTSPAKAKPTTAVGTAMTQAKAQDDINKKLSGTADVKVIKGFGKKPEGKVIHAVTDVDQSALCDARIKDIAFNVELTGADVTCAKCKGYAVYKQLVSGDDEKPEPAKKSTAKKSKDVKTKKGAAKKKDIPKDAGAEDDPDEVNEVIDGTMETLKSLMTLRLQKMEKRLITKLEAYCEKILDARPLFFIARKANNMYQIIHDPSRYVICDNVKESDAEVLLELYLAIEAKWDGQSKPSSQWLSAIRKIHEKHFPKKAPKDESKRSLKRRSPRPSLKRRKDRKPEKRVIKRRSK